MHEITLNFNEEDDGLNLTGSIRIPNEISVGDVTSLKVAGAAKWRNFPKNTILVNKSTAEKLNLERKVKLKTCGIQWIGGKARDHNILVSYVDRQEGDATSKAVLEKFFKAIGASTVKIDIVTHDTDTDAENE